MYSYFFKQLRTPDILESVHKYLDYVDENVGTLANFIDFQVNITHELYNPSILQLGIDATNLARRNEVDFVSGLIMVTKEFLNGVYFTTQFHRTYLQLYVKPIDKYITEWTWFFEVFDFSYILH